MRSKTGPTAVVDTNVWISAALSPHGAPAQVLRAILLRGLPVFSEATFAELASRLWKHKFDRYIDIETRKALLRDAQAAAIWIDIPAELETQHWSRDPSDDAFVRTALAAQAPWLITGDDDLLSLTPIQGLTILTPASALRLPTFAEPRPAYGV